MIATLKKFFNFCAKENRRMFYYTLVIGVLIAICEASKFPAIYLVMDGLLSIVYLEIGFLGDLAYC